MPAPATTTGPLLIGKGWDEALTVNLVTPLRFEVPHHLHHGLYILHWRLWQNPVTKIEDVPRARSGALQQFSHLFLQFGKRRKQRCGIQVAMMADR